MEAIFLLKSDQIPMPMSNPPASRLRKRASVPTQQKPAFVNRNGRRYMNHDSIPYCLPSDVKEMSRQALWHELSRELYSGYSSIDFKTEKIPGKVLDVGCGSGIWSASMADYYAALGRPDVEFTGLDLVPPCMDMKGVDFRFVKHDVLHFPLPFEDNTFDFVFCRDMMLCSPAKNMYAGIVGELLRILKPGGVFELQCSDYVIRTIQRTSVPYAPGSGAYDLTSTIKLSPNSENLFVQQWNERISNALLARDLPTVPCTLIGPSLVMEDQCTGIQAKRLALPLDTIWWESQSVDSASDASSSTRSKRRSTGGSSVESLAGSSRMQFRGRRGSTAQSHQYSNRRSSTSADSSYPSPLMEEERAVRQLAKLAFVQLIEAMEPILREANNIDLDDWDGWYREMMWSWFEGQGLRGGECMEFGAWWGRKRSS